MCGERNHESKRCYTTCGPRQALGHLGWVCGCCLSIDGAIEFVMVNDLMMGDVMVLCGG